MENQQELTDEQKLVLIKKAKEDEIKFITGETPYLESKKKYLSLLTEIDELYLKRIMIQGKLAQMQAPDPEDDDKEETPPQPTSNPKERKLKSV